VSGNYSEPILYGRLFRQARPYRRHVAAIVLFSLIATPLALLVPVPLKIAVDSAVGSEPLPGFLNAIVPGGVADSTTGVLVLASVLFVAVGVLMQLQYLVTSVLSAYTGERLVLEFRTRLFRHVQGLSLYYHDARGASDSTYRIQYDAPAIQYVVAEAVPELLTAVFTLVGMVAITALIDWRLALVALCVVPILLLCLRLYRNRLRNQWMEAKRLESSAMSVVQEVIGALRVVKAFGQESREETRFSHHSTESMRARIRTTVGEGTFGLLVGATIAVGTAMVLFIGVRGVQAGRLTLGELLIVMAYIAQLYDPLQTMSKKAADLQGSIASAERAFRLLDEVPDVRERPNALPLTGAAGTVEFQGVSFAYEAERPVIRDVSFALESGTRLGISGRTGAGKTTLIGLLTRFHDPCEGRILLDGIDLRDYRLADLRNQFALVLQEPVLFSSSIGENIAYARPDAREGEIVAAAKAADAHDFIVALPDGYAAEVGERGMRLSGGERQRISLARAFLKDAPILILDEPTSSVDIRTEAAIMGAMERLMAGRTTLMIAHRLSTLERCDLRLELDGGRIAVLTPASAVA
jgi:ATP-binding cassette, subfamily B, bacterial